MGANSQARDQIGMGIASTRQPTTRTRVRRLLDGTWDHCWVASLDVGTVLLNSRGRAAGLAGGVTRTSHVFVQYIYIYILKFKNLFFFAHILSIVEVYFDRFLKNITQK